MSEHDRSTVGQDDSHQHKSHATAVGVLSWSKRVASGRCHDVVTTEDVASGYSQNIGTTEDAEKVIALQRRWLGTIIAKTRKFVDIAIIATVIVAVWGLFSLPVIFIAIEEV